MVPLQFDWLPGLKIVSAAIFEFGADIRSVKVPLERSVREVMAPSLLTNFDVGGRPPWEPDLPQTDERREGGGGVLVATGTLRDRAGQVGVWQIDGQSGEAILNSDAFPPYGAIHQDGWVSGPARPWAVIQDEDVEKIGDIFDKWINERLLAAGLI